MKIGKRTRLALVALTTIVVVFVALALLSSGNDAGSGDPLGAEVDTITIDSEAVGQSLPVSVVVPEGADDDSGMLVFLHGKGGSETSSLTDEFYEALDELGSEAPVVAFPYGGDGSYWHDRDAGEWGTYVTEEVIPQVADETGADSTRVAIGGISMGGYGALNLAAKSPGRFCAVAGHSPAIWETAGQTAEGAFDDDQDFTDNNVITAAGSEPKAFSKQPLWIDAGDEDPFLPGDNAFIDALAANGVKAKLRREPGGHNEDYWNGRWDDYLGFYADALAECDA